MKDENGNTEKLVLKIPNISCKHCVHTINTELGDLEGVIEVNTDLESKTTQVKFIPPANRETIINTLLEINYPPSE